MLPGLQATVREALWFSARLRLGPEINNRACGKFIAGDLPCMCRAQRLGLDQSTPAVNTLAVQASAAL